MSVDCTYLLNMRHLEERDNKWMSSYPEAKEDMMSFDEVRIYSASSSPSGDFGISSVDEAKTLSRKAIGIVSYGDGVLEALKAKAEAVNSLGLKMEDIDVIDSP